MVELEIVRMESLDVSVLVVLKEKDGARFIGLNVHKLDAFYLYLATARLQNTRPLTHELYVNTLLAAGITVDRVLICDLVDNMLFGALHLNQGGRRFTVECRPSDGITIALRMHAPIMCQESVLETFERIAKEQTGQLSDQEALDMIKDMGDDIPKS
jgi:bifunctional DNase/RNase